MFADMHISIMLATMAIFLAMIVILNSIFYKPLLKFIDERNDSIRNDENKVKENSQEVLGANTQVEEIYKNTRDEIQKIKQNAINQAKLESEQILKSKKDELEGKMIDFQNELLEQKEQLKRELLLHLPSLKESLRKNIKKI